MSAIPSATASQTPAMPCSAAARRSPAPTRRATAAVVEYARKLKMPKTATSTLPATARPPSGSVPRWPTIAVSTRM